MVMFAIIFLTGQPEPAPRTPGAAPAPQPSTPDANRLRDYQDRLRVLEAQRPPDPPEATSPPVVARGSGFETAPTTAEDPIVAERRRREYESLFASNVVSSRRPEGQRIEESPAAKTGSRTAPPGSRPPATPAETSIDDIADAVVRATTRATNAVRTGVEASAPASATVTGTAAPTREDEKAPSRTDAIRDVGSTRRLLEGTVIDTVLTNRLDGGSAAPVNCLITNPVYSHANQEVVIPAGARILGSTRPVQAFGETRLAVAFHRLVMPDGSSITLDQEPALNQRGDAALRDRVDHHYLSTFGAASAVGLISGLSQFVGTAGFGGRDGTVVMAGGALNDTSQAGAQVMSRFLNRLPTLTIREGHRVKVYLTHDLDLPLYRGPDTVR